MQFLNIAWRLRPVFKPCAASWDLAQVIKALCGPQYEHIENVDKKFVSFKTAVLLPLTGCFRAYWSQSWTVILKLFFCMCE